MLYSLILDTFKQTLDITLFARHLYSEPVHFHLYLLSPYHPFSSISPFIHHSSPICPSTILHLLFMFQWKTGSLILCYYNSLAITVLNSAHGQYKTPPTSYTLSLSYVVKNMTSLYLVLEMLILSLKFVEASIVMEYIVLVVLLYLVLNLLLQVSMIDILGRYTMCNGRQEGKRPPNNCGRGSEAWVNLLQSNCLKPYSSSYSTDIVCMDGWWMGNLLKRLVYY